MKTYEEKLKSSKSYKEFLLNVTDTELVEMMFDSKPLRRKGQGKTQRTVCPHCNEDMNRSSVRKWNGKTSPYISNGWECQKCKFKQWD